MTTQTTTNGSTPAAPKMPVFSAEQQERLQQADVAVSLAFARIVSMLMRSPMYAQFPLGDLNRLIVPPLLSGQYATLDGTPDGSPMPMPVAMALWAWVSPELDQRLTNDPTLLLRLEANDWTSGNNLWLVEAVGDPRALPHFFQRLAETEFKGRVVKERQLLPDGRVVAGVLMGTPQARMQMASAGGVQ